MGALNVLNVGAGDLEFTYNHLDDEECQKALKVLEDMQARGYAILVRLDDGTYARAERIDRARGRYILQLPPGQAGLAGPEAEVVAPRRRGRAPRVSAPIAGRQAVGVARSAGG